MTTTPESFKRRLGQLKADLVQQSERVLAMLSAAYESVFDADNEGAERVIKQDDVIDRVDVDIERAAVTLLTDVANDACSLSAEPLRELLTIVKVNNELERIGDRAVSIALLVPVLEGSNERLPDTGRVLASSVIGVLRDTNRCFDRADRELARVVLRTEHTVEEFKKALVADIQQRLVDRSISPDLALAFQQLATYSESVADHCSNTARQVIYLGTGAVFRHTDADWEEVELPPTDS